MDGASDMADFRCEGFRAAAAAAVALLAAGLGAQADAFTFTWGGHEDARADAPPAERRFTFPWAAHVDMRSGDYAAQQFVQHQLPAGLPMHEAVARARAAHSSCNDLGSIVICRYSISSAADEASLGEELWTLTLTRGPDGKLATAAIDRARIGIPGDLGTRAVFHWELGN